MMVLFLRRCKCLCSSFISLDTFPTSHFTIFILLCLMKQYVPSGSGVFLICRYPLVFFFFGRLQFKFTRLVWSPHLVFHTRQYTNLGLVQILGCQFLPFIFRAPNFLAIDILLLCHRFQLGNQCQDIRLISSKIFLIVHALLHSLFLLFYVRADFVFMRCDIP